MRCWPKGIKFQLCRRKELLRCSGMVTMVRIALTSSHHTRTRTHTHKHTHGNYAEVVDKLFSPF